MYYILLILWSLRTLLFQPLHKQVILKLVFGGFEQIYKISENDLGFIRQNNVPKDPIYVIAVFLALRHASKVSDHSGLSPDNLKEPCPFFWTFISYTMQQPLLSRFPLKPDSAIELLHRRHWAWTWYWLWLSPQRATIHPHSNYWSSKFLLHIWCILRYVHCYFCCNFTAKPLKNLRIASTSW